MLVRTIEENSEGMKSERSSIKNIVMDAGEQDDNKDDVDEKCFEDNQEDAKVKMLDQGELQDHMRDINSMDNNTINQIIDTTDADLQIGNHTDVQPDDGESRPYHVRGSSRFSKGLDDQLDIVAK